MIYKSQIYMNKFKRILYALIVFLVLSSPAFAEKSSPKYLPMDGVHGAEIIGPPPAIGSEEFNTQMAIVMWHQKTRTPEQVEFVSTTLNLNRFAPIIGDELFDVDGVQLRQTMADVINEVRDDYDAIKAKYDLPRPFAMNDQVKPPISARPVGSYPSGHAIRAVVYAAILGEVFPEKKNELMELALQIGYGRVVAGVHYPIDVTAGQKLGNAYADAIIKSPAFKEALSKIRSK